MRRIVILIAMLGSAVTAVAQAQEQTRLTIEDCYRLARANYPLVEQYELIDKTAEYNLANAAKGWLPQVMFSAQTSYQSDVTQLPFDPAQLGLAGMSIPTLSRDQYGAKVEVGQTVWDGGAIRAARDGVQSAAEAERATTEANLYALNERVNGLFFGILLAEGQLAQMALLENNLTQNRECIEAYVRNGIAMQADLDAIRIEQLKANQQKAALVGTRRAYIEMLSRLTGVTLGAETVLVKPSATHPANLTVNRPELAMFDAQIGSIEARERRMNAAIMPRLGLFATGGYGKPGLNMLADKFEAYYVMGAKLSWNIGGLYTRKNDWRQIATDIRRVEVQRDAFLLNADLDISQKNTDIDRLREQLRYDDEIIELRGSVLRSSEAKMANGTLSGSDLARDINAEQSARQDKVLHEMELLLAIYNIKFAINN
jgi:outer membrane protein TolC